MKLFGVVAEAIGVVVACAGVFMIHIPTGLIVSGMAVVAIVEARA